MTDYRQPDLLAKEQALNNLEAARPTLIAVAKSIARRIAYAKGTVTSVQVAHQMRLEGWGEQMDAVDPRWLGCIFKRGTGWERVGYEPTGSHGRPVSVWRRMGTA